MTRKERKDIQNRIQLKTTLRQFYSSYGHLLNGMIQYADRDIRSKLLSIENLFSPDIHDRQQDLKKKRFEIPITYHRYVEFQTIRGSLAYRGNKEFKRAMKNLKSTHERQWFRNLEIFNVIIPKLQEYIKELKGNRTLKRLCKVKGDAGEQARLFKARRLKEAQVLLAEYKRLVSLVKKEMFINDIESCIRSFVDFFVTCQFRLDKFFENVSACCKNEQQLPNKKMIMKEVQRDVSLELPGWSTISKFE